MISNILEKHTASRNCVSIRPYGPWQPTAHHHRPGYLFLLTSQQLPPDYNKSQVTSTSVITGTKLECRNARRGQEKRIKSRHRGREGKEGGREKRRREGMKSDITEYYSSPERFSSLFPITSTVFCPIGTSSRTLIIVIDRFLDSRIGGSPTFAGERGTAQSVT